MQFKSQLAKKCHKQEPSPNFTFFHFYPSTTPLQTPHHTYKERKRKITRGILVTPISVTPDQPNPKSNQKKNKKANQTGTQIFRHRLFKSGK